LQAKKRKETKKKNKVKPVKPPSKKHQAVAQGQRNKKKKGLSITQRKIAEGGKVARGGGGVP